MLVKRDPIARQELHRELEDVPVHVKCSWCGSPRLVRNKATPKLWRYYNELDNGHVYYLTGLFCSASCYKAYHG